MARSNNGDGCDDPDKKTEAELREPVGFRKGNMSSAKRTFNKCDIPFPLRDASAKSCGCSAFRFPQCRCICKRWRVFVVAWTFWIVLQFFIPTGSTRSKIVLGNRSDLPCKLLVHDKKAGLELFFQTSENKGHCIGTQFGHGTNTHGCDQCNK